MVPAAVPGQRLSTHCRRTAGSGAAWLNGWGTLRESHQSHLMWRACSNDVGRLETGMLLEGDDLHGTRPPQHRDADVVGVTFEPQVHH